MRNHLKKKKWCPSILARVMLFLVLVVLVLKLGANIGCCVYRKLLLLIFFFAHPIYSPRIFSFSASLPRRNSDPGPVSRLFSPLPPPHYDTRLHLYREKTSGLSSLVDSRRIAPMVPRNSPLRLVRRVRLPPVPSKSPNIYCPVKQALGLVLFASDTLCVSANHRVGPQVR